MANEEHRIMLPWSRACFVCGEDNDHGMNARSYVCDDRIELPFEAPQSFAGWRTVVHGGLVATVLDEVMTWAAIVGSRKPCYAAEFTVRMLKPLPPGTPCIAVGEMVRDRKRVFNCEGALQSESDEVFARAQGRYMIVPKEKMDEFRNDFISGPDCHGIDDILNWGREGDE